MRPGDKPGPVRSPLGYAQQDGMDCEDMKRRGFREHQILVVDLADPRIKLSEWHMLRNIGNRLYGD